MILATYTKQPAEVLDYDVNFSSWLGAGTISTHTAVVSPTGELAIDQSSIVSSSKVVKCILSGGITGKKYKISVTATTDSGLVKQVEYYISVKEV